MPNVFGMVRKNGGWCRLSKGNEHIRKRRRITMALLERYVIKVNTGKYEEYVNASKIWGAAAE